jgi:hypothetical protein
VLVRPGDLVSGDDDGVVVIPREQARVIAERIRKIHDREEQVKKALAAGQTIVAFWLRAKPIAAARGVREPGAGSGPEPGCDPIAHQRHRARSASVRVRRQRRLVERRMIGDGDAADAAGDAAPATP